MPSVFQELNPIALTLGVLIVTLVAFAVGWFPVDLTAVRSDRPLRIDDAESKHSGLRPSFWGRRSTDGEITFKPPASKVRGSFAKPVKV